ncbi:MAG: hypothetical protein ABW154_08175 [Dyella sp.]
MNNPLIRRILVACIVLAACHPAAGAAQTQDTGVKQDAKAAGKEVGQGARDIGHATKKVATSIGHGARQAGQGIAHGAREGWQASKHAVKQVFHPGD